MQTWSFDDLKRTLTVLFPGDDALVELRVICKGGGALSGVFTNGDDLASYVATYSGSAKGVYTCLNKIKQEKRDGILNELIPDGHGIADSDIESRELLLIDIDVEREDKNSGSTDAEHEAAIERAMDVRYVLSEENWPEPLLGDSGNGAHLIYKLPSLPNDERSTLLVRDILAQLAGRFDHGVLKVDRSVFNASRISKLYGTMVAKGDNTAERPHRIARILSCPDVLEPIDMDILEGYRQSDPVAARAVLVVPSSVKLKGFSLDEFISKRGIKTRPKTDYRGNGYKWQMDCPFNPNHKAPDAALYEYGDGSKSFKCSHDSCAGNGWEQFRALVEPGWTKYDPLRPRPPIDMVRFQPAPAPPPAVHTTGRVATEQPAINAPARVDMLMRGEVDMNDAGNAVRVKNFADGSLLYSPEEKTFYAWDGKRFKKSLMEAIKLTQAAMMQFLEQAAYDDTYRKFAVKSLDIKRINGALESLKPHIAINVQELDALPWALNCNNGTVDLRTGELLPHSKDDRLTKLVNLNYTPGASCPVFVESFSRVLPGMLPHIQKCVGYSVTGDTREKVVFICHGATGDNGKTTLMETVRRIVPEYSCKIMIDSLMAKSGADSSNAQSDLSDLRGARFASTSETESGQRLSEGKLKRITQGMGIIKSARKYENTIEFQETHKLWLDCNHLPVIKGSDNAIWRRLHTVPFLVQIPREQIDYQLMSKLDAEAEGILAWIVAGAVRWYAEGLGTPEFVETARAEWREDMDIVAPFLEARCNLAQDDADSWVAKSSLYDAYKRWAEEQADKRALGREGFWEYITAKGYKDDRRRVNGKQVRVVVGITLRVFLGTN